MKAKKHILVVRSGYPSKEFVLKKLKSLGYHVIVLDKEVNCPPHLVDDWIIADLQNSDEAINTVKSYINSGHQVDAVVTFWEEAVLLTSLLSEVLKLPGIPLESAEKIKNKFKFRQVSQALNLPTPKYASIKNESDIQEIEKELRYPLVIKPVYGAASAFVVKVENRYEFLRLFKFVKKYISSFWLAPEWENLELYVEEYIPGNEVDIDILMQDGEIKFYSITDNFATQEPFFIETGQAIPSGLSKPRKDELIKMAEDMLVKLGVKSGCMHFEAKSTPSGAMPIEINLRMGGDEVYYFVNEVWGVDLVEQAVKIALNEKVTATRRENPIKHLAGSYFLPHRSGYLSSILINNNLYKKSFLEEIHLSKHIGEKISTPPINYDALGWITVSGKSPIHAMLNLYDALKDVDIKITPLNNYNLPENL